MVKASPLSPEDRRARDQSQSSEEVPDFPMIDDPKSLFNFPFSPSAKQQQNDLANNQDTLPMNKKVLLYFGVLGLKIQNILSLKNIN